MLPSDVRRSQEVPLGACTRKLTVTRSCQSITPWEFGYFTTIVKELAVFSTVSSSSFSSASRFMLSTLFCFFTMKKTSVFAPSILTTSMSPSDDEMDNCDGCVSAKLSLNENRASWPVTVNAIRKQTINGKNFIFQAGFIVE